MISVSQLSEYIYCPFKVYLHQTEGSNILTDSMVTGKITHEAVRGFEELIKRNLWALNGDMPIKELLETIFKDVPEFLDNVYQKKMDKEEEIVDGNLETIFGLLKDDLKFESWLIGIKAHKILKPD